jgi:hypothetical protein
LAVRIFEVSFTSVSTSTAFSSCSEMSRLLLPASSPEEISANLAQPKNYMNIYDFDTIFRYILDIPRKV